MSRILKRSSRVVVTLCTIILCGCGYHENPNIRPNGSIGGGFTVSESDKQMVALAFIAYAGDDLIDPDTKVDEILQPCVKWELSRQHKMLSNRFTLAWGPSVFRFTFSFLDDNMMYAVQDQEDPEHVVIAIRGTNPDGLLDWIKEDFFVTKTVAWKYANPLQENARLSKATDIGLNALQGMQGRVTGTDSRQALRDYLANRVEQGTLSKVTVTGHSLAGALAPAFALWLDDTRSQWDASKHVGIHVLPIAGASPGNAEFAKYYDHKLGGATLRLHNPFDLVPQAWYLPTMHELKNIYITPTKKLKPSIGDLGAIELGIGLSEGKDYLQINASQKALAGALNPHKSYSTYLKQGEWQHHCGYYNSLGMTDRMLNVNSQCLTQKKCPPDSKNKECMSLYQDACNSVPIPPIDSI